MKVLFAVSNDNITTSVVNKYQQKYKEIVTSKNVYYFNAIVKELQNDKSYDCIVIEEDLEPISNNNYEAIDKFLSEKLDSISDEAAKPTGEDIPIIFICADRRTTSDQLLRKLFSMGIYNALIGNDRSLDKLCELMAKPRNKKDAKKYYQIEIDQAEYQSQRDELVSEEQIQNILNYYKKIGSNERKCVQAFESISKQYDNTQLRIIVKFLPMDVKAILEARSPIYQRLMSNGTVLSNGQYSAYTPNNPKKPEKIGFVSKNLNTSSAKPNSVVIPTNMKVQGVEEQNESNASYAKQTGNIQQQNNRMQQQRYGQYNQNLYGSQSPYGQYNPYNQMRQTPYTSQQNNPYGMGNSIGQSIYNNMGQRSPYYNSNNNYQQQNNNMMNTNQQNIRQQNHPVEKADETANNKQQTINEPVVNKPEEIKKQLEDTETKQNIEEKIVKNNIEEPIIDDVAEEPAVIEPVKRKRGRPRKIKPVQNNGGTETKRRRGRPRKVLENEEEQTETIETVPVQPVEPIAPIETVVPVSQENNMPIMNENTNKDLTTLPENNEVLPIDSKPEEIKPINLYDLDINTEDSFNTKSNIDLGVKPIDKIENNNNLNREDNRFEQNNQLINQTTSEIDANLNVPIAGNGKIVAFVGTSKNGTSFIVNNVALLLAQSGINAAIVDLTKNKNSYYMFTDNDANKTRIASESLKKLSDGIVEGLDVKNNLTVFTALPEDISTNSINHRKVLESLTNRFEVVLLDCDFKTDDSYFAFANEIYLIQSMDALTIQPLTKFLSDLKLKNILDERKLRAVINKYVKIKKLDAKMIVGGMSKYNEPSMTLQRDLFDPRKITMLTIPFDNQTYIKYLESIALCHMSLNGYSKEVIDGLEKLKNLVYPLVAGGNRRNNNPNNFNNNMEYNNQRNSQGFSNNMNDTLNKMRTNNY